MSAATLDWMLSSDLESGAGDSFSSLKLSLGCSGDCLSNPVFQVELRLDPTSGSWLSYLYSFEVSSGTLDRSVASLVRLNRSFSIILFQLLDSLSQICYLALQVWFSLYPIQNSPIVIN